MAVIGMRHLVVATIKTETDNQAIVYNAGKVMGHAVRGNVTINRSDNPLYGDDRVVDNDNGVTGYELDIATTNISDEVEAYALGMEADGLPSSDGYPVYMTGMYLREAVAVWKLWLLGI